MPTAALSRSAGRSSVDPSAFAPPRRFIDQHAQHDDTAYSQPARQGWLLGGIKPRAGHWADLRGLSGGCGHRRIRPHRRDVRSRHMVAIGSDGRCGMRCRRFDPEVRNRAQRRGRRSHQADRNRGQRRRRRRVALRRGEQSDVDGLRSDVARRCGTDRRRQRQRNAVQSDDERGTAGTRAPATVRISETMVSAIEHACLCSAVRPRRPKRP